VSRFSDDGVKDVECGRFVGVCGNRKTEGGIMKALLLVLFITLSAAAVPAQAPEGIWKGYDGEWMHVSQQLIALAEATPAEKYSWRPTPGVRSTSEVYMHIAIANFYLLSVTGPKMPADLDMKMEKSVTAKPEVIAWLKKSLQAVKTAHLATFRRKNKTL
jgi:hypothetical protein